MVWSDVTAESHSGSLNLASSFNSMSFNIGIALRSAVGALVTDDFGIRWLGPFGAVFALLAFIDVTWLAIEQRYIDVERSNHERVLFVN
jgi:predicted MFS family arabinose efflux permease